MATTPIHTPTKTIKISQTIRLDIDFDKVESVRIVDVDLLILLKDGQRLIVPEGAVRALMDNEFSINFKGKIFSVASLMELQTFEAKRVTEVGIVTVPDLPKKVDTPGNRDVARLDLTGEKVASDAPQPDNPTTTTTVAAPAAAPARASTEADAQARLTDSEITRLSDPTSSSVTTPSSAAATGAVAPAVSATASNVSASATEPPPVDKPATASSLVGTPEATASLTGGGLSTAWKYAVGVLGAGVGALASRVGAKSAVEALAPATDSGNAVFPTLEGVIALGPLTASKVYIRVLGRDAAGKAILLSSEGDITSATGGRISVDVTTGGKYSIQLTAPQAKTYTGPIVVVLSDATSGDDYLDEATNQPVDLSNLVLRSITVLSGGKSTVNITPLTELAVRAAVGKTASPKGDTTDVPASSVVVTQANTAVAKAFGLGSDVDVATAPVRTVLDNGFQADGSVGTKYALALAALSGVDSTHSDADAPTASDKAAKTLDTFASYLKPTSTTSAPISTLTAPALNTLMTGAVKVQPVIQDQLKDANYNASAQLATQISTAVTSTAPTTIALVAAPAGALGLNGQDIQISFSKAVPGFAASDVQFDRPDFSLQNLSSSDKGLTWKAHVAVPTGSTGKVTLTLLNNTWISNTWTWDLDTSAPTVPTLDLTANPSSGAASDSGTSPTDRISNVKTPTLKVQLQPDSAVGDVLTVTLKSGGNVLLDAKGAQRVITRTLNAGDITNQYAAITLDNLGSDGLYQLEVVQRDAAGNQGSSVTLDYTLDTTAPPSPVLAASSLQDQKVYFGPNTPLGLINLQTKLTGFVLSGTGAVPGGLIKIEWDKKVLDSTVTTDNNGNWSVRINSSQVPDNNPSSKLVITQQDVAGNVSTPTTYTVEVATSGVKAVVNSLSVADNSGTVTAGGYSRNAQGNVPANQSTDDTTPVVTVRLSASLLDNEVIQVFDTANPDRVLFTLSGLPASTESGFLIYTSSDADWTRANAVLGLGQHTLNARVINTHTLDSSAGSDSAAITFVVQSLDFNQLLLSDNTNLIAPNQSAGAAAISDIPQNKPTLAGTLKAPLGRNERLAVYDTVNGTDTLLGTATPTAVVDSSGTPTGTYTWRFTPTQPLANGGHTLSVRLETVGDTPQVRLAMSQDVSVALPILSIAPASVSPNGKSTDTGDSDSDGISNNPTPMLRLVFPVTGRVPGDLVEVRDATNNNALVASHALTADEVRLGVADFVTNRLGATSKTLNLVATFAANSSGLSVPPSAPLTYVYDVQAPNPVTLGLSNDTSGSSWITKDATLVIPDYDPVKDGRLEFQVKLNGRTLQAYSTTRPQIVDDGTYEISARLVDIAGNISRVTLPTNPLGKGDGTLRFIRDTRPPSALPAPTLAEDTTNGLPGTDTDNISSNFRLRDDTQAIGEANALVKYQVLTGSKQRSDTGWVDSYLKAIWLANAANTVDTTLVNGVNYTQWLALNDTDKAKKLTEGQYTVLRYQTDQAGNAGPEVSYAFTLDTQVDRPVLALFNDTSGTARQSQDARVAVSALDGTPGVNVVVSYKLEKFATADYSGTPTSTTTRDSYTPPASADGSADGYYRLTVTQTNRANLTSSSVLDFQLDTQASVAPTALVIAAGSDTTREAMPNVELGDASDHISRVSTPTFDITLPSASGPRAPQNGDVVQLFRKTGSGAAVTYTAWGQASVTDAAISAGKVSLLANTLAPASGQPAGSTDGTYTFVARLVDKAGNPSAYGPELTYTLDTQVSRPVINSLHLRVVTGSSDLLPENFINGFDGLGSRDSVTFTGTAEGKSLVSLGWGTRSYTTTADATTGVWSITVNKADWPADTERLAKTSTVTVSVTDVAGNTSAAATLNVALNTGTVANAATITRVADTNISPTSPTAGTLTYSVDATGDLVSGQTTAEHRPTLYGTLLRELPAATGEGGGYLQEVRVYADSAYLGNATVTGTRWQFTVPTNADAPGFAVPAGLLDGQHRFRVEIYDPLTRQHTDFSTEFVMRSNGVTMDPLGTLVGDEHVITNTSRPTLSGKLLVNQLAPGEVLAVYDVTNSASPQRLGSVQSEGWADPLASVNSAVGPTEDGTFTWTFDVQNPASGRRTFRVQIEDADGHARMAADQSVRFDLSSVTLRPGADNDTGRYDNDAVGTVNNPWVRVLLASSVTAGQRVELLVNGSSPGSSASATLSADDVSAGHVDIRLPSLTTLPGYNPAAANSLFSLGARVNGVTISEPLVYTLDTTPPTLASTVDVATVTGNTGGRNTGFTSNKTLSKTNTSTDPGVYDQVQVVPAGGSASAWMSVDDFNATPLADGTYTLNTRTVDLAGNIGPSGPSRTLKLDTRLGGVGGAVVNDSAASAADLKSDGWLNRDETGAGATLKYKLTFSEKILGLTLSNLGLEVSGADGTQPGLSGVEAVSPDGNGYATDWLVTLSNLNRLSQGETVKLQLLNATGIIDQAGNSSSTLTYTSSALTVDREATVTVLDGGVTSNGSRVVFTGGNYILNASGLSNGLTVAGTVGGVQDGQTVTVSVFAVDSLGNATGSPLYTSAPGTVTSGAWSAQLVRIGADGGLNLLADRTTYALKVQVQDVAGNTATTTLNLGTRLSATLDVGSVKANTTSADVLSFGTTGDLFFNSTDKTAAISGSGGVTVSGTSTIGGGRVVTISLVQMEQDSSGNWQPKVGGSTITGNSGLVSSNPDGSWTATFTRNQIASLSDGTWQLRASGSDAFGNAATNDERYRLFTVDTQAEVTLDTVGGDGRVNLSTDGDSLQVTGGFSYVEQGQPLTLKVLDKGNSNVVVWTSTDATLNAASTWSSSLPLTALTGLTVDGNGVANLILQATTTDRAGNSNTRSVEFTLDRTAPGAPVVGDAVRLVAGDSLLDSFTSSLKRSATLADSTQGVLIAPAAGLPTVSDIAVIQLTASAADYDHDQWRVGTSLVSLNESVTADTSATVSGVSLLYTYDASTHVLSLKSTTSTPFTAAQVQSVLRDLAWVNTQDEASLAQTDRTFTVHYLDAYQNVGNSSTITVQVDTVKPTTLTGITLTPTGGTVVDNTVNTTTTNLSLSATIDGAQAAGGKAEFYVGGHLVGTDTDIGSSDTTVTYSTGTSDASALQTAVTQGGAVEVRLYDRHGNHLDITGPTLTYDLVKPRITSISTTQTDGSYKAGVDIPLRLRVDTDMTAGSTLTLTLETGAIDRTVTLTRDSTDARLFTGTYTVQPGDTNADLSVNSVALGSSVPREASGNTLDLTLPTDTNSLEGSSDLVIDTTAPTTLTGITLTPVGGVVVSNTLNSTNTALTFSATIGAAEATGGRAEFYIDSTLIGTTSGIRATDTSVSFTTATSTASALQAAVTAGGVVKVKLYDKAGNLKSADGPTLVRELVLPSAVDLTAALDIQNTQSIYADSLEAAAGKAFAPGVQAPSLSTDNDIVKITVVLGGINLDVVNDKLVLNADLALNGATPVTVGGSSPGVAINGVSGLTYTYTLGSSVTGSSSGTLVISKQDGSVLSGAQVQSVVAAIKYKNTQGSSLITDGPRTATFSYTDSAGNTGTSAVVTLTVDRTVPSGVDLSAATDRQPSAAVYVPSSGLASAGTTGVLIAPDVQAPSTANTRTIKLVMGGLDTTNDKLVLEMDRALSADLAVGNTPSSPVTIGTVTGLTYSYTASTHTLLISKQAAGVTLVGSDVQKILAALKFKNGTNASMQEGNRTFDISLGNNADRFGDVGTVTLTVDRTAPTDVDLQALDGRQALTKVYLNATTAASGLALAAGIQQPGADDTRSIKLELAGATFTPATDQLVLGTLDLSLNTASSPSSSVMIGGVAGLTYRYTTSSPTNTLIISKADGTSALTKAEVQSVLAAIKFKSTASSVTEGERTVAISYTDMAGNVSANSATVSVNVDRTLPTGVDLKTTANIQATDLIYANLSDVNSGVFLAANADVPSTGDTKSITLALSGFVLTQTRLVLDSERALSSGFDVSSAPGADIAIGSVTGLRLTFSASSGSAGTLVISKADGSNLTPANVQTVMRAIKFKSTATADTLVDGDRVVTFTYTDLADNVGPSATVTVRVDHVAPSAVDLLGGNSTTENRSQLYANVDAITSGVVMAPGVQAPSADDTKSINVTLSGFNASTAFLILETPSSDLALNSSVTRGTTASPLTIAGVGGLTYTYTYNSSASTGSLVISKLDGLALTKSDVQSVVAAIKYKSTAGESISEGDRSAVISYTDLANNTGTAGTAVVTIDKTAPSAVDLVSGNLDASSHAIIDAARTVFGKLSAVQSGLVLAANADKPAQDDTQILNLTWDGSLQTGQDKLLVGDLSLVLKPSISPASPPSGDIALGALTLSYTYNYSTATSSGQMAISKKNGTPFTATELQTVLTALKLQNDGSPVNVTEADRRLTISYTDRANNTGSSAVVTVRVDTTQPPGVDLLAADGIQAANNLYVNYANAVTGLALAAGVQQPTTDDIGSITVKFDGSIGSADRLQLANLGAINLSSSLDIPANSVTINSVGVTYGYTNSSKTLVLTKTDGTAFTRAEVQSVLTGGLTYKASSSLSATAGTRTAVLKYTDMAGNVGDTATVTFTVDNTAPSAVDLSSALDTQAVSTVYANATSARDGVAWAAGVQAPALDDTKTISVTLAGTAFSPSNDKLVLNSALDLNANTTETGVGGAGVTIGTVSGLAYTYSYNAGSNSGTLLISKVNGTGLVATDVQKVVAALKFQNTQGDSIGEGNRTATISYTDLANNTGTSATVTLTVDRTNPDAVDLDSTSEQTGRTQTINVASLGAFGSGVTIAPSAARPAASDIRTITLALSGAGLDVTNDKVLFNTVDALDLSTASHTTSETPLSINSVDNLSYQYTLGSNTPGSSSGTLVISKLDGTAFSQADVQRVVQGLLFGNGQGSSMREGNRVLTFSYTDLANNTGSSAAVTFKVDRTPPSAVDLSPATDVQASATRYVNVAAATAGVVFAPDVQAPALDDTAAIRLAFSGFTLANAKLVLETERSMDTTVTVGAGADSSVAIGTVSGLTYTYTAGSSGTGTLVISKKDGTALTKGEVQLVVKAIQYKSTAGDGIAEGDRTATISYTDLANNTGTAAVVTVRVDKTAPDQVDLSSATVGPQNAIAYVGNARLSTAGTSGVQIASDVVAPENTDIAKITLRLGGGALDVTNDILVLGTAGSLSLNAGAEASGVTIGTAGGASVSGMSYTYTAATGSSNATLVLSKTNGTALSGAEVKTLMSALLFKNTTNTAMTEGDRTFTISYTDLADNTGLTGVATVRVDKTAPSTVDVDSGREGIQTATTVSVNAAGALAGAALFPTADKPAASDTRKITLVLGGSNLDTSNDKLVLDTAVSLNTSITAATSGAGVSINGITGLTYSYDSGNKKLEILRVNGAALSDTDVRAVLQGIKYQNTASPTGTDRTATLSYTDMADNTGGHSVVTWTVDTVAPTVRSIGMSSSGRQNNFVNTDDDVLISVKFSEAVNYTAGSGTAPTLNLNIGSTPVSATYTSGSGTDTLVFTYKILSGQTDANGISIPATGGSPIVINSGAIRDLAGNDATLTFGSLGDDATLKVDTAVPTITGVTVTGTDSSGTAKTGALTVGDKIKVTINTSESVIVSGNTSVSINVGTTVVGGYSASRTATYVSGSGTSSLVYTYEIQAGDTAAAGAVTATTTPLTLTGAASVTDLAGNLITNTVASTPTLAASTSVSTAGVPNARVTSASLSADTAPDTSLAITTDSGLAADFITRTAAQTITGNLTGTAANGDKVQISLNNGSTWTDLATYNGSTSSWTSSGGTVTVSGSTTTYSYAATLSGANTLQARVLSSGGVASSAWRQAYVLDTSLVNTFNPGLVITTSPVFSGIADPGAYIKLELDTNASITGSGASATGYELTYLTQANNLGYWSVNTASLAPVSGAFTPLTATPSGGSNTNIRVTAADKAGNSSVVTASAPVVNTTYALSNANVIEGTSGTRTLAFLVTRAGDLSSSSTVNYAVDVANSSAVQGVAAPTLTNGDFSGSGGWTYATSGAGPAPSIVSAALNFANTASNQGGYATQDVTLNAGQRYTVSWAQTGTPSIAFGVSGAATLADQSVSGSGSKSFSFTALSSGTATLKFADNSTGTGAVTVDNVTMTSPGSSFDYTGTSSGTVSFGAGETAKLISFSVTGDYYKEINDKLTLSLSNPSGGGSVVKNFGVGVIQEVDATRMQAIYSLEDVNPNLVTFAVNVRRASDNATQDIGFDAYGQLDTVALLKFASNNGTLTGSGVKAFVTKWYDQSGNGRDLVQTANGSQGVIVNNGAVITRSDGSYGISFNKGLNGTYDTVTLANNDFMTTTNGANGSWTDAVISVKVESTGTENGSLFQLGNDDTNGRISAHYPEVGTGFVWDVGNTNTATGRLQGGTVSQGVANDLVFDAHVKMTTAGTSANNFVDATQAIFENGIKVVSDATLPSSTSFTSGSTWYLAYHGFGSTYYQNATYSEFSVFFGNASTTSGTYDTPTVQVLRGSAENDVLTYSGETVTTIDGGAGYDVLYLQGATNLTPALLTNGMANIEQIWAQNGSANTISLTDADLLKNPAPLLINMDAGDRVILNGTSYDYSAVDTQSLMVDTTGDDTLIATGANDHFLDRGGSNTYVWLPNQTGTDRIDGFSEARDKLDISKLLQGYSSGSIASYVTVSTNGYDTTVRVDLDGSGPNSNIQTIVLKDVAINSTADQLLTAGALKVL